MKERPIIFSGESVRAIMDGRKTQTRRVVKLPPDEDWVLASSSVHERGCVVFADALYPETIIRQEVRCPFGVPGQLLWVREAFTLQCNVDDDKPPFNDGRPIKVRNSVEEGSGWRQPHYRATDPTPELSCSGPPRHKCDGSSPCCHWSPAIYMPRWASRLTLEITAVRVERIQDITPNDCELEGMDLHSFLFPQINRSMKLLCEFKASWDSINGKRAPWSSNPWVWVTSFRKVENGY